MSNEKLAEALKRLPPGFYAHSLGRFANGTVRTTKKKTVVVPIEIGIEQLGSPFDDLRAILSPENNKLIPLLVFVDLSEIPA